MSTGVINITNQSVVTDFAKRPIRQKDGGFECPAGPRFGIEVVEDAIANYRLHGCDRKRSRKSESCRTV
jgi:L-alanine-DL-glutamate epimerase-like enolase superfamily enzyme